MKNRASIVCRWQVSRRPTVCGAVGEVVMTSWEQVALTPKCVAQGECPISKTKADDPSQRVLGADSALDGRVRGPQNLLPRPLHASAPAPLFGVGGAQAPDSLRWRSCGLGWVQSPRQDLRSSSVECGVGGLGDRGTHLRGWYAASTLPAPSPPVASRPLGEPNLSGRPGWGTVKDPRLWPSPLRPHLQKEDHASFIYHFKASSGHTEKSKTEQVRYILVIYLIEPNISKLLLQHVITIVIMNEIFCIPFFQPRLQNLVPILLFQHISVQTSHVATARWPAVAI